eukprot:TRINITY_DN25543_c0_g1_i1.p1 TRINITY_DN25543_c0_g1~~TRINITY_DN25543_c0_g1_i1.p1  ORF type:complete len:116 (+),score=11.70 TRINITY_DN25543_c0_g1_i1:53-349(+)
MSDQLTNSAAPPSPPDASLERNALLTHYIGTMVLLCLGTLRSAAGPPTVYVFDVTPPYTAALEVVDPTGFYPLRALIKNNGKSDVPTVCRTVEPVNSV